MRLVLGEDLAQVAFVHDEDSVEELTAYAANPPLRDRVHPRHMRGGGHYADAFGGERPIEQGLLVRRVWRLVLVQAVRVQSGDRVE